MSDNWARIHTDQEFSPAHPQATMPDSIRANSELSARLSAIVDSSDDAIVSKDLTGRIQSWNRAAELLFGYTAEEAVGRSIRMLIPDERQDEEDQVLATLARGERIEHYETVRRRKDGSLIDISLTVSPLKDVTGRVIGASKIARDISVRKRAEEALERSLQVKEEFLSLVSHELRTPISMVVGNGNLLLHRRHQLTDYQVRQALEDLVSQGERLQAIIENLLLLTRMDRAEPLDLEPVHLARLVSSARDAFLAREPRRVVLVPAARGAQLARGDPGLLSLVLDNLLTNASKYSPADEPIEVRIEQAEDGWVEAGVMDRGIGFGEGDTEVMFTPFYRSAAARQRAAGMGLGLAVCRRAMEAQGGTIFARRREGGGSEFVLRLPSAIDELTG